MSRFTKISSILVLAVVLGGCYNARVNTGLVPSEKVVKESWAPSWIAGAVSPPIFESAAECPDGVAQVHTYHSFLNMLVAFLTLSIFTPMSIEVTCARPGMSEQSPDTPEITIERGASAEQRMELFEQAIDLSARTGQVVTVRF